MLVVKDDSYVFHPGYYLLQAIEESYIDVDDFIKVTGLDQETLYRLLSGLEVFTIETSAAVSSYFGISPDIWIRLQNKFIESEQIAQKNSKNRY